MCSRNVILSFRDLCSRWAVEQYDRQSEEPQRELLHSQQDGNAVSGKEHAAASDQKRFWDMWMCACGWNLRHVYTYDRSTRLPSCYWENSVQLSSINGLYPHALWSSDLSVLFGRMWTESIDLYRIHLAIYVSSHISNKHLWTPVTELTTALFLFKKLLLVWLAGVAGLWT